MRRVRSVEPRDLPLAVVRGEFWAERKVEIAEMGRVQLERELRERGLLSEPGLPMLYLRWRLSYVNMIEFYTERDVEVPQAVLRNSKRVEDAEKGPWPYDLLDIFYDARAIERERAKFSASLEQAIEKDANA